MQMQPNETALIFQEKLKTLYQSQDKIAPLIEGLDEIPQQSMKDYYVKLQIIVKEDDEKKHGKYEDISGKKKEVEPQKIFENFSTSDNKPTQKQASRILILGGAGVGKSTLMQYMAYKWSIGEMWKEANFDYVYRVTLKTLLNPEWKLKPWPYYQNGLPQSVLKCLVHYNLTKNFKTLKERNELKPDDIPWTTDERTILLLDGYDEIAHLADEDPDYDIIMEEIFEHKRVIFTSRPNAINPRMKERFDRIVENTGLDDSGIEQYFRQYFKNNNHEQKGKELDRFLSSNSVIKDICKIPVNIAMLCYIWSSSDSDSDSTYKLDQISSVSDLYQEVVHRLTQRFYAHKKWRGAKVEGIKLNDKLNNGSLDLDELKVLTHVAYKGMTGGGIDIESKNRVETLIIKGAQDKEGKKDLKDEVGISIQSSINYLAKRHLIQHDLKEKVDINNVYRFGLLKTEGATISYSSSSKGNEKEPEETDLHKQNYSFIHLTFQEYLTACYLKDLIKNGGDQDKNAVCQYIAEHRNEPRYLMTMKFMAGAITADQEQTLHPNNEFAVMFWDSMICNVDGVIELGGETKISLLMHLLGQAKVKGELDSRIPHKEDIINLIDFVVLDDLVNWSTQLKESDYMSDTIKEGLIKAIVEGTLKWHEGQKNEISKKFSSALKDAIDKLMNNKTGIQDDGGLSKSTNMLARALEMGNDLIAKLTPDDRLRIVKKLKEIILKHQDQEWQLVLQASEGVIKMNSQGSLSQEDVRELISGLIPLLLDKNLGQKSRETICAIMRKVEEPQIKLEAMDKIWKLWLETKAEVVTRTIFEVIKSGVLNKEILEKARQQLTDIFLKTSQGSIAIDSAIELSAIIGEKSILGHLYDEIDKIIFNPSPKEKKDPMQFIPKLAKAGAVDEDRIAKTLEQIITLNVKGSMDVIYVALNATIDLIDLVEAKKISEILEKQLTEFLNQSDRAIKKKAIEFAVMLAKKRKLEEPLVTKIVQRIMSKSADENEEIRLLAVLAIMELAKNVVNDNQLLVGLHELVLKFFSASSLQIRHHAVMIIAELAKTRSMKKQVIQKVAPLVIGLIDNDKIADVAIDKTVILADIAEDKQIIHNLHEAIHKLFDKADNKRKEYAIKCIVRLAKTGKVEKEILAKSIQQVIDLILDDSEISDHAIDTIKDFDDIFHDKQIVHQAYQQLAKLLSESEEHRKDSAITSAVILSKKVKVDDQILAQIIQQIISLLSDDSIKIRESVIHAITEFISIIKDQKMLETLYEPVCKAFSDSEQVVRQSAIELGFKLVTTGTADNEISIKVLQQIGSLLADKDIIVRLAALRATRTLTSKIDNKQLLDHLNDSEAIIKLLDDPFWDIKITAIEHAIQLVKTGRASKEILAKTIQRVSNLINDNSGRYGPLSIVLMMSTVVEIIEDQETLHNLNDSFAKFFKHPEPDIREHATRYAVSLAKVRKVDNKEALAKTIQQLINLALDRSRSVAQAAMQALAEIAGVVEDKEILHNLYASVTNLFDGSDTNKKRYFIELTEKLATAERSDKQALVEAVKRVINLIADNDFAIMRYAVNAVAQLGTIEEYKQTIQNISLTQVTELSTHLEGGVRYSSIQLALTIARSGILQKELLDKLIQQIVNLVDDDDSSYDVGEFAVNAIMDLANHTVENLLLNVSDFTRYLKHPNKSLRTEILGFLSRSLQQALKKFSVIDKLLKNHQDLPDVQVISDQLFDNKMDQIARKEIDTILSAMKRGDVSITMATLKDALLSRINWSGHSKFYELIETALMVIGFEQAKELASSEKELREVAQKILNCQLSNLNGEGIKWINDRFHVLSNLSQESKLFFKNLYHTLLKDSHISATEEELIIKFVNQGFTTSITRTAKIRFEAKEYSVASSTNELHLENLARSVINQEKDILAFQYKDHHPLFGKMSSSSSGMKKAAIDIESVFSIVDKSQPLSADAWFLTRLQGEKDGKMTEIVLLEQRSVIGDNLVYLLNKKQLIREHPENISKRLTDIFGVYSPARKFKGESKILELNEGNETISGTRTLDLNQIKFDKPKDYFHQELLDLGNTDRLNYISSELSTKLTNYNEILNRILDTIKPALSPENKTSVQEYCQAFIRTFAMVYVASQTIADGRVVLNVGDMKTTILSTLVSFIPVYGDTISSAVTSLGEFLKSREIQQNARKMVNLQPEAVGLNQLIGEVASKIISNPAKRQEIYDITEEELLRLSGTLWEKFNKLLSILQEKVDSFVYGQQYQTAAAKLGNKDANTLIGHWMKDKINPASVQEEFVKHALSGLKAVPSQASSPVKAPEENTRPRTNCCQLFAVSMIRYDNPLLNQQEFLQKFASSYGIKALNSLIDISRKQEL